MTHTFAKAAAQKGTHTDDTISVGSWRGVSKAALAKAASASCLWEEGLRLSQQMPMNLAPSTMELSKPVLWTSLDWVKQNWKPQTQIWIALGGFINTFDGATQKTQQSRAQTVVKAPGVGDMGGVLNKRCLPSPSVGQPHAHDIAYVQEGGHLRHRAELQQDAHRA